MVPIPSAKWHADPLLLKGLQGFQAPYVYKLIDRYLASKAHEQFECYWAVAEWCAMDDVYGSTARSGRTLDAASAMAHWLQSYGPQLS